MAGSEYKHQSGPNFSGPSLLTIVLLVAVISLAQIMYFKIGFSLRQNIEFNFFRAVWGADAAFGTTVTTIVVLLHLGVSNMTRRVFGEGNVKTRYAVQFIISSFIVALGAWFCNWFYATVIYNFDAPGKAAIFNIAVQAIMIPIILTGLLETFYYRGQWQREQFLREQEKRQMVSVKFEALKNQLSPHFVFNSFNTLGALIDKNAPHAQEFLAQLSTVYRYILDNKDRDTVSLGDEVDSVMALLHIQENRHPGAVKIDMHISKKHRDLRIIPLTLHTLVENIFKHNTLSATKPISLKIQVQGDKILVVENTLRQKLDVESHHIGIKNLSRRYELLIQTGLNIIQAQDLFRVEVPFIDVQVRV